MSKKPSTDWDDLRILLAVIRRGRFLAAGAELDLAVSTVSRRIAQFETRTSSKLIERRSDGAHPTPAGLELAELDKRMELDISATLRTGAPSSDDAGFIAGQVIRVSGGLTTAG